MSDKPTHGRGGGGDKDAKIAKNEQHSEQRIEQEYRQRESNRFGPNANNLCSRLLKTVVNKLPSARVKTCEVAKEIVTKWFPPMDGKRMMKRKNECGANGKPFFYSRKMTIYRKQ